MRIHTLARTWLMAVIMACAGCSDPGDSGSTSTDSGTSDATEDVGDVGARDAAEAAECVASLSIPCEAGAPDAQGCKGPPVDLAQGDASGADYVVYPVGCEATHRYPAGEGCMWPSGACCSAAYRCTNSGWQALL